MRNEYGFPYTRERDFGKTVIVFFAGIAVGVAAVFFYLGAIL